MVMQHPQKLMAGNQIPMR